MSEKKRYTSEEVLNLQSQAYQKGLNEGYQLKKQQQPRGAGWVKGVKGFPVKKRVIAKYKHYDDPLRDWVVGYASTSTGEMITFDWNVSSITLDINHERWNMLYWLDESESPAEQPGREVEAIAFAEWAIRNGTVTSTYDGWIHGSKRLTTTQLWEVFKKEKV